MLHYRYKVLMMTDIKLRKPSSVDVARLASVSQATVSYVLNGKSLGLVSDETRERVLAAARQVGYRPNSLAKALLKGRTNTIGVFVSYLGSRFHADIVLGAQEVFEEHGYSLLLTASETDHLARASRMNFMMDHRVDALMLVGGFYESSGHMGCLDVVLAEQIPCVVVDDGLARGRIDCVVSDDVRGLELSVNHLVSLGHTRIAYLAAPWTSTTASERSTGYHQAMAAAGLSVTLDLCPPSFGHGDAIADLARAMLQRPERPTAIIAANDHMLGFVVKAMRGLGLRTPDDVALVGYANQELSMVLEFTTVDQIPRNMGSRAAKRLLERLEGRELTPETIKTPVSLIVRSSTIGTTESL